MSKLTFRAIPFLALLLLIGAKQANAQGGSVYFGVGSAWDGAGTSAGCASKNLYDDFTAECEPAPKIGGTFGVFGADFMILPHIGVNGEYAFRFAQAPYLPDAGLNMRPGFYDFNAVFEPTSSSDARIVPVIEGGVGGAKVSLYETETNCVTSICSTQSYAAGLNANHFQIHGAVGAKLYVHGSIFIKPQFDIHYVRNLNQQFGSNWVPEITVAVGFSFGAH